VAYRHLFEPIVVRRALARLSLPGQVARETNEFRAKQFMQWFVKEQVEELALMSDLLNVVERAQDNLLQVEDYLARERPGEGGGDPTAPPLAAGGE